jgi:thymidylate synthase ThyX
MSVTRTPNEGTGAYYQEEFTEAERSVLLRHFTNTDRPVFALLNMPEVTKGALFARYSRSPKSLRRLFLDEFHPELSMPVSADDTRSARAEQLYERVLGQYGDDSVAQLGVAHLACEQASNLLTKILERPRLMSYMEQSTRYIPFGEPLPSGEFRYYRDPDLLAGRHGQLYQSVMATAFSTYRSLFERMQSYYAFRFPALAGQDPVAWKRSVRAQALDSIRGLLPAATLANVGIVGSGQAFEHLVVSLRASQLPEAHRYADMVLEELRRVIPAFLTRVDRPDRGSLEVELRRARREDTDSAIARLLGEDSPAKDCQPVRLLRFDRDGEARVVAAILFENRRLSGWQADQLAARLTSEQRRELLTAYCGPRSNRRHKPGRAFEHTSYLFEIVSDYGAFRDLQRHRMATIEWQPLHSRLAHDVPPDVADAGLQQAYDDQVNAMVDAHLVVAEEFPVQSTYFLPLCQKMRYQIQMNAREAMHLLELRSSEQAHPAYRQLAVEMHRLIREEAGHVNLADMMIFVNGGEGVRLVRETAENRRA